MKFLILFLVIVLHSSLMAQTKVCYTYDNSGNRTSQSTSCGKSTPATPDSTLKSQPIAETLGEIKISIYPNPTQGQLLVNITNLPPATQGEITLYDLTGKLLFKQNTIQESTLFDLSNQPKGIYIVGIRAGDKLGRWKVIKQ